MRNRDKRFDRALNDARFAHLVKVIEQMLYHDTRITYDEILDAAFVAYCKYREANPTLVMKVNEEQI